MSDAGGHPEDVRLYRRDEFVRMGFVDYVAAMLADTRIDLHMMEDLIKSGCRPDTAARILMGTTFAGDDPAWGWTEPVEDVRERQAA